MTDAFVNQWRVTEYVFDADGTPIGVIRQQRHIERLETGNLRVTQICTPDLTVPDHPMQEFAGEWVFEMKVEGNQRFYLGADVVGNGWAWGKDCITGRGIWPRFGHNFTSYGVMISPTRQITGGQFFNVNQLVATIVGVAENTHEESYPSLVMDKAPHEVSEQWRGLTYIYDDKGKELVELNMQRDYHTTGWEDCFDEGSYPFIVEIQPLNGRDLLTGEDTDLNFKNYGISQRIGCSYFASFSYSNGTGFENSLNLLDVASRTLTIISQDFEIDGLATTAISKLTFEGEA